MRENKRNESALFDRIAFAHPKLLLVAICDIYDGWRVESDNGVRRPEAGSDIYVIATQYFRPEMLDAVRRRWCEIAHRELWEFPFSDDFVCDWWIRYRKEDDRRKESFRKQALELGVT